MHKRNAFEPRSSAKRQAFGAALRNELDNLPSEITRSISRQSCISMALTHVVEALQQSFEAVSGNASASELNRAAALVRSHVAHAHQALLDAQAFAGKLEGLAWIRDAVEAAHAFTDRK